MIRNTLYNRGLSLVEVVIGTALILLSLTGLVTSYSFFLKAGLQNTDTLKASFLLQEGVEAVTLIRDGAWSNLSSLTSGTWYGLDWNGTAWTATTTAGLTDSIFLRTFKLEDVYRRTSDKDIVDAASPDPKSVDANTKKLTMRVVTATTSSATSSLDKTVVTYLANLFE